MEIAIQLFQVGEKEKGLTFIEEAAEGIYHLYQFPTANNVYISAEKAPTHIDYLKSILIQYDLTSEKLDAIAEKFVQEEKNEEEDEAEIDEEQ